MSVLPCTPQWRECPGVLARARDVGGLADCGRRTVERPEIRTEIQAAGRVRIEGEYDARVRRRRLAAHYASRGAAR